MENQKSNLRGYQINALRVHPFFKKMDEEEAIEIIRKVKNDPNDQETITAFVTKQQKDREHFNADTLFLAIDQIMNPEKWRMDKQVIFPSRIFTIKGDGMNDGSNRAIIDGDIVTVGEVWSDHWVPKILINKRPCLLITTDGRNFFGHIKRCGLDSFYIVRLNPDKDIYPNFRIDRSQIEKIYQVFRVTREMRRLTQTDADNGYV